MNNLRFVTKNLFVTFVFNFHSMWMNPKSPFTPKAKAEKHKKGQLVSLSLGVIGA